MDEQFSLYTDDESMMGTKQYRQTGHKNLVLFPASAASGFLEGSRIFTGVICASVAPEILTLLNYLKVPQRRFLLLLCEE